MVPHVPLICTLNISLNSKFWATTLQLKSCYPLQEFKSMSPEGREELESSAQGKVNPELADEVPKEESNGQWSKITLLGA